MNNTLKLNQGQLELFNRLKKDREENAAVLDKTSMKGVKSRVADKYSEQAHFIYELLQNADDAKATKTRFVLEKGGLIFAHNGTIRFSISDPDSEKEEIDRQKGRLGHLNSITSIAHSTKSEAEIGKFGIGFKSVFQYTNTPHIYDPPFIFKIERFIVPVPLGNDHPERKPDETLFYFPFQDVKEKSPAEAFKEIEERLHELNNPLLFLKHISEIDWKTVKDSGYYVKQKTSKDGYGIIALTSEINKQIRKNQFIVFSNEFHHNNYVHTVDVAYLYDDKKILHEHKQTAYCFLSTQEITGLRFIINAPFLLTDNREGIKKKEDWNHNLIKMLAKLSAKGLYKIKEMGLFTTDFLAVLPNAKDELSDFYKPIQDAIVQEMQENELLPGQYTQFISAANALDGPADIKKVMTDDDLAFLCNNPDAQWIKAASQKNSRADDFITMLDIERFDWEYLVNTVKNKFGWSIENEGIVWLKNQTDEWMQDFYVLLHDATEEVEAEYPSSWAIVRTQSNNHVNGEGVYFPFTDDSPNIEGLQRVKAEILKGKNKKRIENARNFLEKAGVKEAGEREEIEAILKTYYTKEPENPTEKQRLQHIKRFIEWWQKEKDASIFAKYYIFLDASAKYYCLPQDVYLDKPFLETGLSVLFGNNDEEKYALWDGYLKVKKTSFVDFAIAAGVVRKLIIEEQKIPRAHPDHSKLMEGTYHVSWSRDYGINKDYKIENLKVYLKKVQNKISQIIWNTMCHAEPEVLQACYRPNSRYDTRSAPSTLVYHLKSQAWIPDKKGNFHKPVDISKEMLPSNFPYDDRNNWLTAIGFGDNIKKQQETYKQKLEWAKQLGIPWKFIERLDNIPKDKREQVFSKFDEVIENVLSPTVNEPLPKGKAVNPDRRKEKAKEQAILTNDKEFEERMRNVRTSSDSPQVKEYLKNLNQNENGNIICQMCNSKMPFKMNNEDYFEKQPFIRSLEKEIPANHIALCPNCAAEFQHACSTDDNRKISLISELDDDLPEDELVITLDMPVHKGLRFTQKHLIDLKGALIGLRKSEKSESQEQVSDDRENDERMDEDADSDRSDSKKVVPNLKTDNIEKFIDRSGREVTVIRKPIHHQAKANSNRLQKYNICPYCAYKIKESKYQVHIEQKCPKRPV